MPYSTVSNMFSLNYGQGVMLGYAADSFRISASYVNGFREVNDQFDNTDPRNNYAFSGRAEVKIQGNWDQFNNAQSFKGEEMGILLGLGAAATQVNDEADSLTDLDKGWGFTADLTFDFGGASVMGAFYYLNAERDSNTTDPYGYTVQGGVFVADDLELIARYEFGTMDTGSTGEFSALTFGANWYLAQNTAKFGANFGYAFDAVTGLWAANGQGNNWLADDAADDGQWMIQAQLSFSF